MSTPPEFDVVGVGSAIVDVLSHTDEAFLDAHDLPKGAMVLVDGARAAAIYDDMGPAVELSGGSAANTIAGVAALGGRSAFIGKVRDDQLGAVFSHDIRALGVHFQTPPAPASAPAATARSMVLVTDDAQRTMCTDLGIAASIDPDDIDRELVGASAVTFLEGYLWDPPAAIDAMRVAIAAAHDAGRLVAFTLSDSFCVDRHRAEFAALVADGSVDVLFANEAEIVSLYEVATFEEALERVRTTGLTTALTRSERGSVVVAEDGSVVLVPAEPADVVDTTGAGDLYAAGFLFNLVRGEDLDRCGALGSLCAAEVISHIGARPEADLRALAAGAGLIDA